VAAYRFGDPQVRPSYRANFGTSVTHSYLRQDPDWTPTYGPDGSFTMVDLLRTADVVSAFP
jgi:hypothetical protein